MTHIKKVDHIGIACRKVNESEAFYHGVLGLELLDRETLDAMKLKVVKLKASEVVLELLEPLKGETVISKFLDQRGEGIHHLCFEVDDLEGATKELSRQGYRPVWETSKSGAGKRWVNFLRPKDTGGVLIELSQKQRD